MTIQTSNEHQRAFSDSEMDQRVVWDDYQRADLDGDLEEYLVETYDPITYVDEDESDEPEEEEIYSVEEKAAEAVGVEDAAEEDSVDERSANTEVVGDDGRDD